MAGGILVGVSISPVMLQSVTGTSTPVVPGTFYVTPLGEFYIDQSGNNYVTP